MTPKQIELVQETLNTALTVNGDFSRLFYNRLFSLDPTLRFLFDHQMEEQQKKLMEALRLFTRRLDQPDLLIPSLRYLGQRHAHYGVRPDDYQLVQRALVWALAETLDDAFTEEARGAWGAACQLVTETMKEAVEQTESAPGF